MGMVMKTIPIVPGFSFLCAVGPPKANLFCLFLLVPSLKEHCLVTVELELCFWCIGCGIFALSTRNTIVRSSLDLLLNRCYPRNLMNNLSCKYMLVEYVSV